MEKSPWGVPRAARQGMSPAPKRERDNATRRQARAKHAWPSDMPDVRHDQHLRRNYGITLAEYDALFEAQGGVCALCKRRQLKACGRSGAREVERMHVDHDHKSGKIRGLLCALCNRGLGCFSEDPDLLEWAAAYLRKHCSESTWMLPA